MFRSKITCAAAFAVISTWSLAVARDLDVPGELNSRFSISGVDRDQPSVFIYFTQFRVLPDGRIKARATYGEDYAIRVGYRKDGRIGIRSDRTSGLRGKAVDVQQQEDGRISAVLAGRGGGLKFRLRIANFVGRADAFKGKGWVRYRGKRYRVKVNNTRSFASTVTPF